MEQVKQLLLSEVQFKKKKRRNYNYLLLFSESKESPELVGVRSNILDGVEE